MIKCQDSTEVFAYIQKILRYQDKRMKAKQQGPFSKIARQRLQNMGFRFPEDEQMCGFDNNYFLEFLQHIVA
jgi:hypothetical protein